MTEIEKMLQAENREKKQIGYGAQHRASRQKGFKGGVKLPFESMKGKERKNYMQAVDISSENLRDPIPWKEFKEFPIEEQKRRVMFWGEVYGWSAGMIGVLLNVTPATGVVIVRKLGLMEKFKDENTDITKKQQKVNADRVHKLAAIFYGEPPQKVSSITKKETGGDMSAEQQPSAQPCRPVASSSVIDMNNTGAFVAGVLRGLADGLVGAKHYSIQIHMKEV